jgi:hypothetical protein
LLAFVIGLYFLYRLAKVKEVGEVEEKIVIHEVVSEIRRPMTSLSTAGGLHRIPMFPFSVLGEPPGPVGLKSNDTELAQDRGENTGEPGDSEQAMF